ncbi:MAG TPA: AI-2E family transporter [Arenibaculum sp.]|nr:AI-2E family transporter [Arenibaculum sp.]
MTEKSAAPHLQGTARPIPGAAATPPPSAAFSGPLPRTGPQPDQLALMGLFTLAVFYTLYVARDLLLPIFLASLLGLLLRPVVKGLRHLRIPEWLGAALVVVALLVGVAAIAYGLSEPAATWIQSGPVVLRQLEFKLGDLRESIDAARQASREIEQIAQPGSGIDEPDQVILQGPSLAERVLTQTQVVFAGFLITLVLLYFFLAESRHMLERLIGVMPHIEDRMHYAGLAATVQRNIASYLATVTIINTGLGMLTAGTMWLLGVPNPILWGVVAGTLNFIPYLGSAVTLSILTVVSILSFDELGRIAAPPLAWIVLTSLEGNFVTPTIVGRRLTLNPIAVVLAILFWGWMWGVPGALLAVPILAVFKIVCDAHKPLHGIGALLGGRAEE